MPEVVANGVRIHYQQFGSGPDSVFIHAVTSNLAVWLFSGLPDALAADFRVTVYDLRGHGASERPPTGYSSAVMADDFSRLHSELGLGPAYLVGHSFGGVVATHAAVVAPERVAGVVLSDTFFPGLRAEEPNFGKMTIWEDVRVTFSCAGVNIGDDVDFSRLFHEAATLSPAQNKIIQELVGPLGRGWLRQLPLLAATTCGEEVLTEAGLTAERIAAVSRPVVALYDEFSPFRATLGWLGRNLRDCTAEIIPAAKHLAVLENTAAFTDAVRRHLRRLAGIDPPGGNG